MRQAVARHACAMTGSASTADPGHAPSSPGPARAPWVAAGGVGAVVGLAAWLLMSWSADCEGMECLGTGLVGLAAGVLVLPLLAVVGLSLVHVDRPVRTGLLGCLASLSLVPAAMGLEAAARTTVVGSVPLLPTVVLGAVASGWAALVVASDRFETGQRWATGLSVLLVFALTAAASS